MGWFLGVSLSFLFRVDSASGSRTPTTKYSQSSEGIWHVLLKATVHSQNTSDSPLGNKKRRPTKHPEENVPGREPPGFIVSNNQKACPIGTAGTCLKICQWQIHNWGSQSSLTTAQPINPTQLINPQPPPHPPSPNRPPQPIPPKGPGHPQSWRGPPHPAAPRQSHGAWGPTTEVGGWEGWGGAGGTSGFGNVDPILINPSLLIYKFTRGYGYPWV